MHGSESVVVYFVTCSVVVSVDLLCEKPSVRPKDATQLSTQAGAPRKTIGSVPTARRVYSSGLVRHVAAEQHQTAAYGLV